MEQARQSAEGREERLASWRHELDSLYQKMEEYLNDYINSGLRTERRLVQLTEDYLGTYEAEALAILIGRDEVTAEPVGTMLIGSRGCVDLSGPRKTLRIVWLKKGGLITRVTISEETHNWQETDVRPALRGDIDCSGWYFVTPPPDAIATPLNEDSFRDAVMDVVGG